MLAAAIIALNACPMAKANLGDTYQTSVARLHGNPGRINADNSISWVDRDISTGMPWIVTESFYNNRCVAVNYIYSGAWVTEDGIWRTLAFNYVSHWSEYRGALHTGQRTFVSADGAVFGSVVANGTGIRVAYKSWLDHYGLLTYSSSNSSPPKAAAKSHKNHSQPQTPNLPFGA